VKNAAMIAAAVARNVKAVPKAFLWNQMKKAV
jgi:hypothetical protein